MDQAVNLSLKDFVIVVKALHFIDGVKVWNLLSNLDFDWRLLHRKPGTSWPSIINCQTWISTSFLFPLIELELALVLIAGLLSGIRAVWNPGPEYYTGCVIYTTRSHLFLMSVVTIGAYAILLITMLFGLLRQRQSRSFGVWTLLFHQGWIWFALAVAAEVPTLVMVLANVNPTSSAKSGDCIPWYDRNVPGPLQLPE
ncbi:hypothetical protein BGW80DRAFT_1253287 [Lactifluus volemus]|nr:hypothetical protein BGW80DRAFT_1253287 [Lactifluus volemus]